MGLGSFEVAIRQAPSVFRNTSGGRLGQSGRTGAAWIIPWIIVVRLEASVIAPNLLRNVRAGCVSQLVGG